MTDHSTDRRGKGPKPQLIEAFGEAHTLREWLDHPKCAVPHLETIRARLWRGWSPEDAISLPSTRIKRRPVTAFGETRLAQAWSRDERCAVPYSTLLYRLSAGDMTPEQAITTPPTCGNGKQTMLQLTAFGETRTVAGWVRDSRCKVRRPVIYQRLRRGWSSEDAITLPFRTNTKTVRYAAFGETKSLREWSRDQRCRVPLQTLQRRVHEGIDFKYALTAPAPARRTGTTHTAKRPLSSL